MPLDPFTLRFAARIAAIRAARIARPQDREDVVQDLLLEVTAQWPGFDAARGTCEQYVEVVIKGKVAKILRDRRRQKRDPAREEPLNPSEHDRPAPGNSAADADRRLDVEGLLALLPPDLRAQCEQLRRDTVSQVARESGMPRSSLDDALSRVRELYRRDELL